MLKQDWPHKWPTFIPDIVAASKTSEPLCENSMVILKLLSEEIFDFSRGELTQVRTCAPTCLLPEPLSFLFLGLVSTSHEGLSRLDASH